MRRRRPFPQHPRVLSTCPMSPAPSRQALRVKRGTHCTGPAGRLVPGQQCPASPRGSLRIHPHQPAGGQDFSRPSVSRTSGGHPPLEGSSDWWNILEHRNPGHSEPSSPRSPLLSLHIWSPLMFPKSPLQAKAPPFFPLVFTSWDLESSLHSSRSVWTCCNLLMTFQKWGAQGAMQHPGKVRPASSRGRLCRQFLLTCLEVPFAILDLMHTVQSKCPIQIPSVFYLGEMT